MTKQRVKDGVCWVRKEGDGGKREERRRGSCREKREVRKAEVRKGEVGKGELRKGEVRKGEVRKGSRDGGTRKKKT